MEQKKSKKQSFRPINTSIYFPRQRKRKSLSYSNQKGYSLLEILIVLVLIVILSAIAVPQTNKWIEHYRLNGATRLVWADLQSAKMTAIKNNQSITVTFDTTTGYHFIQGVNTIFTRDLTHDYPRITLITNGGNSIIFLSTGMTQNLLNPVVTVTIQGSEETKTVTTLWTGRILST